MTPEEIIKRADRREINRQTIRLEFYAMKGMECKCSACGKTGNFGSIVKFTCRSGNIYQICGWCGNEEKK